MVQRLSHEQHWHTRVVERAVRDASEQRALQTRYSARAHDQQVGAVIIDCAQKPLERSTHAHFAFRRPATPHHAVCRRGE